MRSSRRLPHPTSRRTGSPAVIVALVSQWVRWLPTHADWAGIVAGPLVLIGYLVGSIPFAYLLSRRRLRRQLDGLPIDGVGRRPDSDDPLDTPGVIAAAVLSGVAALLVATVAWDVGTQVAPRTGMSAIGTFSNQAIGAWASIALWTGAGTVVGHVAPPWTRFRGGTGIPPAVALALVYTPALFIVGATVFVVADRLTGDRRRAFVLALPAVVSTAYLTWIGDVQPGWGITNGPEVTVWTAVVCGILAARNLRPTEPAPNS